MQHTDAKASGRHARVLQTIMVFSLFAIFLTGFPDNSKRQSQLYLAGNAIKSRKHGTGTSSYCYWVAVARSRNPPPLEVLLLLPGHLLGPAVALAGAEEGVAAEVEDPRRPAARRGAWRCVTGVRGGTDLRGRRCDALKELPVRDGLERC
jgi:hypothetical protein